MADGDHLDELAAEQRYVDVAYGALEQVCRRAEAAITDFHMESSRLPAALLERDIGIDQARQRLLNARAALAGPVCFGRLDFEADGDIHVGRLGVEGPDHTQLVVDWRAPIASSFYRATPSNPHGVVRRRHIRLKGRTVAGLDDEVLDVRSPLIAERRVELVGEAALLAALVKPRGERMSDIVATIQAEQDVAIRAPGNRCLTIQGGPGTGKTAVALHRVSYLLFENRTFDKHVLVVGPSARFLKYIRDVLPSLGEHDARLATCASLYFADQPLRREDDEVARLKGEASMATVLRRGIRLFQRVVGETIEVPWGSRVIRLEPDVLADLRRRARSRRGGHNEGGRAFRQLVRRALWNVVSADPAVRDRISQEDFDEEIRTNAELKRALHRRWPILTPEQFVRALFSSAPLLTAAGRGLLQPHDVELLVAASDETRWTEADAPLLDEAAQLLGPVLRASGVSRPLGAAVGGGVGGRARGLGDDGHGDDARPMGEEDVISQVLSEEAMGEIEGSIDPSMAAVLRQRLLEQADRDAGRISGNGLGGPPLRYELVVVDEAQDVSAMGWRMIRRRAVGSALTVVGDLAQGTWPWSAASWEEIERRANVTDRTHLELQVGYRTPAEVMGLAERILARATPDLVVPMAVRTEGADPSIHPCEPGQLVDVAFEQVRRALASREGLVAAFAVDGVRRQLTARCDAELPADERERVSVLEPSEAKGLEFDSVVVVEPAAIVAGRERGWNLLYVVVTRTLGRLAVVHSQALPWT